MGTGLYRSTDFRHSPAFPFKLMIRKAFVMQMFKGSEAEYERRHNPIWPELAAVLKAHGVHNYSIFLNSTTNQLFGYVEIEDAARWEAIAQTEVCQKWWAHMRPLMACNPEGRPASESIREVFHLD